jgi:hypothetical protein
MHFRVKNTLKDNRNHTSKQTFSIQNEVLSALLRPSRVHLSMPMFLRIYQPHLRLVFVYYLY